MRIHKDFTGGNIRVKSIDGDLITLENELRDSDEWFYWAFCVEEAQGCELTFNMQETRLGYYGPAVSYDLKNWRWLGASDANSFTYRFGAEEKCVYFAHHMLYHPERFLEFIDKKATKTVELCKSRKGRSVPCLAFGEGERSVILTARHHACESTGSYVLEGVLGELIDNPVAELRVFCVPFVDYDGVVDGDQGKNRAPHDHNRDYIDSPIYPEVEGIIKYADQFGCHFGFDFHAPWHMGGENDNIFVVRNSIEKQDRFERFADALKKELDANKIAYEKENDSQPMTGWNQPSANFGYIMNHREECDLAFALETTYFGRENNAISADMLICLGKCFAKALKSYLRGEEK